MKYYILCTMFYLFACCNAADTVQPEPFQITFNRIPYQMAKGLAPSGAALAFIVADSDLHALLPESKSFAQEIIELAKTGVLNDRVMANAYRKYISKKSLTAGKTTAQIALLISCRQSVIDVFISHRHQTFYIENGPDYPKRNYSSGPSLSASLSIKRGFDKKLVISKIEDALAELHQQEHIAILRERGEVAAITELEQKLFTEPDCDIVVKVNQVKVSEAESKSADCTIL
jgi:hypothetical protein